MTIFVYLYKPSRKMKKAIVLFVSILLNLTLLSQNFTEHLISTSANGARFVYAADVDGDEDMTIFRTPCFLHDSITLSVPS